MNQWIPTAIIAFYIVVLYVITWLTRRLSRGGMLAYLLASREMPAWVVAALLTGLAVGGASTIGVAEQAFRSGISAGWYNAAWGVGAIVMGLVAAKRYRELKVTTIPELFERYYGTEARIIGVLGQLVIQVVISSLQYVAGAAILSSLLPGVFSFSTAMVINALVFVGITLIGGLWAAGLTNVLNVIVIYVGIVVGAVMVVGRVGGLGTLTQHLPAGHPGFDLGAVGAGVIVGWFLVMCTTTFSTQAVVQISFAAKDGSAAKRGYLWGGLAILPVGFICALMGMAAAVLNPRMLAAQALPQTVLGLNPFIAGIILSGLWAADVSTACGLLLGSATLVVNDVVKRFYAANLSEKGEQIVSRVTVLALSVLTYLLAMSVSGILKTLLIGLTLNTAYTLVTLMTIFLPSWCRRGSAGWTLLATMVALAVWMIFPAVRVLPHPIYFTWIMSLLTFAGVMVLDRRPIAQRA